MHPWAEVAPPASPDTLQPRLPATWKRSRPGSYWIQRVRIHLFRDMPTPQMPLTSHWWQRWKEAAPHSEEPQSTFNGTILETQMGDGRNWEREAWRSAYFLPAKQPPGLIAAAHARARMHMHVAFTCSMLDRGWADLKNERVSPQLQKRGRLLMLQKCQVSSIPPRIISIPK